jgi:uncharacterized protein (TIGR03382 family)
MGLTRLLTSALLLAPSLVAADVATHAVKPSGHAASYDFVVSQEPGQQGLNFARQVLPPGNRTVGVVAQSRTIFLNKNGVTLQPGNNDSSNNRSTIVSQATTFQPYQVSATDWATIVACEKELFAPFDATITDVDPGAAPHIEAVFGGSPTQVGLPTNVAGVSPFTTDCSIIESSIVFTFTDVLSGVAPREICEIMAQEIAHSFGLDHELLASDPMTYLDNAGANRAFQNMDVSCGEYSQRVCGINGSTCRPNQNSVTLLTERLGTHGSPGDTIAPTVTITSPQNGATVPPGFQIAFNANDNVAVTMSSLFVDGTAAGTVTTGPQQFTTPTNLAQGSHTFRIDVTDGANTQSQEITVTVRDGAPPPGGGNNGGGDASDDVTGGCSTGSGGSLMLAFGLVGLLALRRRR